MNNWFEDYPQTVSGSESATEQYSDLKIITIDDMAALHGTSVPPANYSFFNGDKFFGGFGDTKIFLTDYWTLRQRSYQLFEENIFARGIVRRLITNEVHKGLALEAIPVEEILKVPTEELNKWSEDVENRFTIYGKNEQIVDFDKANGFGSLQRIARMAALLSGDVLVVLEQSRTTNLPQIRLIEGGNVQTPLDKEPRQGHTIVHGVELDSLGRQVAYHVTLADGTSRRVPAFGERSGRRIAWLLYGSERRMGTVRGIPLLAIILQSLREIDRYRDSEMRAAVVNSVLAMFIKKGEAAPGTNPVSGGATRKDTIATQDADGQPRNFQLAQAIPGVVYEELQQGEEPVSYDTRRPNVNFGAFEAAIVQGMAWSLEIPPEILTLSFQNNFSASRAAINEFKLYLDKMRSEFAEFFCERIYVEWLISETLAGRVIAPGMLDAWRDPAQYATFGAWILSDWTGAIKPSVDMLKEAKAYEILVANGFMDRERATKELGGGRFSKNVQRLTTQNGALKTANEPLQELEDGSQSGANTPTAESTADSILALVEDKIEDSLNG